MAQPKIQSNQLTDTGVTPGVYTSANIEVDSAGRIIAAENGTGGGGFILHNQVGFGDSNFELTSSSELQFIIEDNGESTFANLYLGQNIDGKLLLGGFPSGPTAMVANRVQQGLGLQLFSLDSVYLEAGIGVTFRFSEPGEIQLNNDPGIDGYVLTSTGPGSPVVWAPAASDISIPQYQVPFGDYDGITSSPDFTYNPVQGVLSVSPGEVDGLIEATPGQALTINAREITFETGYPTANIFRLGAAGEFFINDVPGGPGQVLTSQGSGQPLIWADTGGSYLAGNLIDPDLLILGEIAVRDIMIDEAGGDNNILIGPSAGLVFSGGTGNVIIGALAGDEITTGSNNVIIGIEAGLDIVDGMNNILIGYQAGRQQAINGAGVLNDSFIINNENVRDPALHPPYLRGRILGTNSTLQLAGSFFVKDDADVIHFGLTNKGELEINQNPGTTGQVLTSGGAGAPVTWTTPSGGGGGSSGPAAAFSTRLSAAQPLTTATYTKVALNVEDFDTNGWFSAGAFTPKVAGYYSVQWAVGVAGTNVTACIGSIYKNGAIYVSGQYGIATVAIGVSTGSCTVYLNGTTDKLELWAYAISPAAITVSTDTYFTGHLVSTTTGSVVFGSRLAAAQTIASGGFTKIAFDLEDFDTNGWFSAGRFTPTVSGYYSVQWSGRINATTLTAASTALYKNGVVQSDGQYGAGVSGVSVSTGSCIVFLNGTTDYLEVFAYVVGTGTPTVSNGAPTFFTGSLISGNSSGSFTPTAFKAIPSSDQTLTGGATTQVLFQTEVFDNGSFYNPATSAFTPPAGLYQFHALIFTASGAFGANSGIQLAVNGTAVTNSIHQSQAANYTVSLLYEIFLNGTDVVTFTASPAGSSPVITAARCFFSAHRIA